MERVKVIVWVSGGVAHTVSAGPFVDVVIHDTDTGDDERGLCLAVQPADPWDAVCDEVWSQAVGDS